MPRPNRKTIRVSANVPEQIIKRWEELQKRANDYLPLLNRSQRIELAILEHIRVLERQLGVEPLPPGGSGPGKLENHLADKEDEQDVGRREPRDQWNSDRAMKATAPYKWQEYLKVG